MRPLTEHERRIVERLLAEGFPGRDEVAEQVRRSLVEPVDNNGSLKFRSCTDVRASVRSRIPVEGEAEDADGMTVHVLLHVVDGKVDELEVYKEDSSGLSAELKPSRLRLYSPYK